MRRLILLAVFLAACDLPPDPRKDPPDPKAVFTLVSVDGRPVPIRCDWTSARWVLGGNGAWTMRERFVLCDGAERMLADGGWVGKYRWAGDSLVVRTWPAWFSRSRPFGGSARLRGDTLVTRGMFTSAELRWVRTGP
ncbi:MAG TPA: hypothetical protein VF092_15865 [Longimicrobium sp.]